MQGEAKALVSSVDIYPSLCELAGLPLPQHLHGKSFVPVLDYLSQSTQDFIYARFSNGDTAISKRYAYTNYSDGESMLFDHKNDPDENVNVAAEPEYQEVVKKMKAYLQQNMSH